MVVVTMKLAFAREVADRIVLMDSGILVEDLTHRNSSKTLNMSALASSLSQTKLPNI